MMLFSIEATRELCQDLEGVLALAKQGFAPVRAIFIIERARTDLEIFLDEIEQAASALASPTIG